MKKFFLSIAVVSFLLAMGSCAAGSKAVSATDLSGEWNVIEINGEKVVAENVPYLGLDVEAKRLYGNAGCNRIMGSLEYDSVRPEKIRFSSVAATRMMCPDMETERKVLAALEQVTACSGDKTSLSLSDAGGKTVMTLEKRQQPQVSVEDLNGEWNIISVNGAELGLMENTPFLAFDTAGMRVHGNAGCNIVNGGVSQEEGVPNSIQFSQMISTMMACPDMDTERQILEALGSVRRFGFDEEGMLVLSDEDGQELVVLDKK